MKSIEKPKESAESTFVKCISLVKNRDLKSRLLACKHLIISAEIEFETKIIEGNIHTVLKEETVNTNVTAKELEKVYTYRMAAKGKPGRGIYDKLMAAPVLGICPLCSHRLVETLDHYLPKSDFPRLVVTPINLIPSCFPCNKLKSDISASIPEEESLHPYFDNIESEIWLSAKVNKTTPPSLTFYVEYNKNCSALLNERIQNHFELLLLNKLYSTQAAVKLANLYFRLDSLYKSSGKLGVQKYLKDESDSRFSNNKNSWQTAFFIALHNDAWFCDGGFKME